MGILEKMYMCKNLGNAWNQRELKWVLEPLTFDPKKLDFI